MPRSVVTGGSSRTAPTAPGAGRAGRPGVRAAAAGQGGQTAFSPGRTGSATDPRERSVPVRLRPLDQQVVVITGASSGIGLVTARCAAQRGAAVVVAARNGEALDQLATEIRQGGGRALAVVADVGRQEDVARIAQA